MREVNLGLIGFGTVGQGMVRILLNNLDLIGAKANIRFRLKAIADLDIETDRGIPLSDVSLTSDAKELIYDPEIDILVELIGGLEPARTYILEAVGQKKNIITANKALLAVHGKEIFEAAAQNGVRVAFEASVAGAIPIVRVLRDGLVGDRIGAVYGIINGTANYMLSEMTERGCAFQEALRMAQDKGYAEADPGLDVEGIDSAHKLVLLILLAFGRQVSLDQIYVEGISGISPLDIEFAKELGYRVKLLAIAKGDERVLEARVHPTMVPASSLLATVGGVYNAIFVRGQATGSSMFYGRGAGMMPTGAAVVADLVEVGLDLGSGRQKVLVPEFGNLHINDMAQTVTPYYLRFSAADRPGVLSKISGILGDHDISIAKVIQHGRQVGGAVPLVMMTHEARESNMLAALELIDPLAVVWGKTVLIRVEENLE